VASLAVLFFLADIPTQITYWRRANNIIIELPRSFVAQTFSKPSEMRKINGVNYPPALFTMKVQQALANMRKNFGTKYGASDYDVVKDALVGGGRTAEAWSVDKKYLAVFRSDMSMILADTDKNQAFIYSSASGPWEYSGADRRQLCGWRPDGKLLSLNVNSALNWANNQAPQQVQSNLRLLEQEKEGSTGGNIIATDCAVPLSDHGNYLSPDAKFVLSTKNGANKVVQIRDTESGQIVFAKTSSGESQDTNQTAPKASVELRNAVYSVSGDETQWSPDSHHFVTTEKNALVLYSVSSTTPLASYELPHDFVPFETHWTGTGMILLIGVAPDPKSQNPYNSIFSKKANLIELRTSGDQMKFVKRIELPNTPILGSATADGENAKFVFLEGSTFKIWNWKTKQFTDITFNRDHTNVSDSLSPDGGYFAITDDCLVDVFNTQTGRNVLHLGPERFKQEMPKPESVSVTWSPDAKQIAIFGDATVGSLEIVRVP
jgi:WD40 repeat protein